MRRPSKVRFVPALRLNCRYNDLYTPDEWPHHIESRF
jgi:hypothetical protein